jgi:hypothetical protein
MSSEISRYKVNQEVQAILVRHGVDLAKLRFSFTGRTLYLAGELRRDGGSEFSAEPVQTLMQDLSRHREVAYLQCELENWVISFESGTSVVQPVSRQDRRRKR